MKSSDAITFNTVSNEWLTYIYIIVIMMAGCMLVMWLGDQISVKGIGNGISMIIFAGIVCSLPTRCERCGRPHSVYSKFHLCRICIRELAYKGEIPGMKKSSW